MLNRRTFAIISHPDAGKTTLTEKFLLFCGAIHEAGSVKSRKTTQSARSDWMEMERQRGISISTSVMQFEHEGCLFNLLDTPGHEDFSEDTYRTLTAVDSALMVIDAVKGVEERTRKLMEICRMRDIPIITFVNKLDRGAKDPLELLDEIESALAIKAQPLTWPIGMGRDFLGVYHLLKKKCSLYEAGKNFLVQTPTEIELSEIESRMNDYEYRQLKESLEIAESLTFDHDEYLAGKSTPVYFGSALNNFGIAELLSGFAKYAPNPRGRKTQSGEMISADDSTFRAFVFKIQANMDLNHRDRVAFCRICSGSYEKGQKLFHIESGKLLNHTQAMQFLGQDRVHVQKAVAGDIIGLINHGNIHIGDTFSDKKESGLKFTGIPRFAPELFKSIRPTDPLKSKQLQHALMQLSQEGAVQVFRKAIGNELILGAIGALQFDVVASRLEQEYGLSCQYQSSPYTSIAWILCDDSKKREEFMDYHMSQIGQDSYDAWVLFCTSSVQRTLIADRYPAITLSSSQEC